jgi:1,2-phenylacetyl-CoA epoxidase PaaB subunit
MPSFEIYYRENDGTLVEKFSVHCATPMHAKVMAHAMKTRPAAEIEVWLGDALVYERPTRTALEHEAPRTLL